MNTILTHIFNEINDIPFSEPVFIYTGVGASAYINNNNNNNNNNNLPLEDYHQFPPFLQDLKNSIPNLHLFIILIDPFQESLPYMVNDKRLNKIETELFNPEITQYYSNRNLYINLYTYKKSVFCEPQEPISYGVDITDDLRILNNFAIQNNITTLYHEFTGRNNAILAEYFDKEIGNHLNHIIYGLSARENHGCQFDLTHFSSYFPYKLCFNSNNKQRVFIKLFNIFYYISQLNQNENQEQKQNENNIINELENQYNEYPSSTHEMINSQKQQVIKTIKKELKDNTLTLLRLISRLNSGNEQRENINTEYFLTNLPELERKEAISFYNDLNYNKLFDYLLDYYSNTIEIIIKIKRLDLTCREIMRFITNDQNIYNWYKNIDYFF